MYPTNQIILGGDSTFNPALGGSIEEQIQFLERYKQNLENVNQLKQPRQQKLIWDEIDAEVDPLTDEQKNMLLQDDDYIEVYTKIQDRVNTEILNLVKSRIESTTEGKELLCSQLKIVKKLKGKIINETNKEMELFKKFKEYSKKHPEVTYDEFIKANI